MPVRPRRRGTATRLRRPGTAIHHRATGRAPPALSPGGKPLAEFGERLLAYLIDYAILFAVSLVILVPVIIAQFSIMMGPMDDFERRVQAGGGPDPQRGLG